MPKWSQLMGWQCSSLTDEACRIISKGGGENYDKEKEFSTPWVRQVISGGDLLRNPEYNKGMAFSDDERDRLHLRGLVPAAVLGQDVQVCVVLLEGGAYFVGTYAWLFACESPQADL